MPRSLALAAMAMCSVGLQGEFKAISMANYEMASYVSNLAPLVIHDNSVIAGPMDERLYILIDIYPNRLRIEALSEGEVKRILLATGIKYAGAYLSRREFQQYAKAQIDFVYIKRRDEYGRPNPLFLVRHGSIMLARGAGGAVQVLADRINFVSR